MYILFLSYIQQSDKILLQVSLVLLVLKMLVDDQFRSKSACGSLWRYQTSNPKFLVTSETPTPISVLCKCGDLKRGNRLSLSSARPKQVHGDAEFSQ